MTTKDLLLALAVCAGLVGVAQSRAESYPTRPVQLMVPFSAGHQIDVLARVFAQGLGAALGQSVVVVNREGAGGTIGFAAAAQAAPDGYTILMAAQGQLTIQPYLKTGLAYSLDSFQPVCQVFENTFAVFVGPQSPHKDFKSLIERARAKPRDVTWASTGEGTMSHLQMSGIAKEAGLQLIHAPYRTFPMLMQDVLAGRVDFGITSVGGYGTEARTLALLADRRNPSLPDIPTVAELGYRVSMPGFGGLYLPKRTPASIAGIVEQACERGYHASEYQSMTKKIFSSAPYLASAAFAKRLADDYRDKGAIIQSLGLTAH